MNGSACGASSETGVGFCGACGHKFAALTGTDASSILLCSSCGVLRAARKPNCPHCKAAYGSSTLTHPRPEGDYWVCLECSFRCRACGFRVPLNHLDMDGGVLCARCGLDQAFEVSAWRQVLQHAHAVAESFGVKGAGRDEEVARLGERQSSVKQSISGANGFEVISSPGYPLCPQCHSPVQVATAESGETTATCTTCSTTTSYALPPTARKMMHGALRGTIAVDHKTGQAAVRVDRTPGAIAIASPTCSAPLPASAESKFIHCAYCGTVSRVPDHTWFQLNGKEPAAESIWLLFHGQSEERTAFDRAAQKHAHKVEARAQGEQAREAQQQAKRQEHDREERTKEETRRRDDEALQEAERERATKRAKGVRLLTWVLLAGGTLVSGGVVLAVELASQPDPAPAKRAVADVRDAGAPVVGRGTGAAPDVRVRSCACTSQAGADKDVFVLQAPSNPLPWSFDWTHSSGFVETESTVALGGAARPGVLPPKSDSDKLRMGIACDGAIVAVVLGNRASGWTGTRNGAIWTTTLPGVFTPQTNDSVDPGSSPATGVDAVCSTPIPVDGGGISLTLGGGKRVRLSLKDGRVR